METAPKPELRAQKGTALATFPDHIAILQNEATKSSSINLFCLPCTAGSPDQWTPPGSRRRAEVIDPLPKLDNVIAVQDAVEKLISDAYAGKLHPRVAAGLAPLLNLQLRALEATELERRLAKVEKQMAKDEVEHALKGNCDMGERDSGK